MKYALRTRLGRDIIAQFTAPVRPTKKNRVIILCDGMPTTPSKPSVLEFFSCKGYWVFHPRYRGTWESGGTFMKESPERDISIAIDHISKGFKDAWSGTSYSVRDPEIILIGSSFGGAAALLAGRDPRVSKVVAFSPLVDWQSESTSEPLDFLERFTAEGFGQAYRPGKGMWKKVASGTFFNPIREAVTIDGSKVFITHAKDDDSVLWRPVAKFAKVTGAHLRLLARGGHMGLSVVIEPAHWRGVAKFLKMK